MTSAQPTIAGRFSLGEIAAATDRARRFWWVFLVTGLTWLLFAGILFRFNYLTVNSIAILFGIAAFASGANQFGVAGFVSGGWKIAHALLGIVFVAAGVIAILNPGGTFVALAAVIGLLLIFQGTFDLSSAFMARAQAPAWWLQLLAGIAEILIGFWASGSWGLSVVVLVAWVAAFAVMRGITEIALAFRLSEAKPLGSR
jgi:uncharacterized membrane protein HdeD (DUF308 family)